MSSTPAQPPRHRWCVETLDPIANEWAPGTRFLNRGHAVERYQAVSEGFPTWNDGRPVQRRLVRETVTYTVEPATVPQPGSDGAQQPDAEEMHQRRELCRLGLLESALIDYINRPGTPDMVGHVLAAMLSYTSSQADTEIPEDAS